MAVTSLSVFLTDPHSCANSDSNVDISSEQFVLCSYATRARKPWSVSSTISPPVRFDQ